MNEWKSECLLSFVLLIDSSLNLYIDLKQLFSRFYFRQMRQEFDDV